MSLLESLKIEDNIKQKLTADVNFLRQNNQVLGQKLDALNKENTKLKTIVDALENKLNKITKIVNNEA